MTFCALTGLRYTQVLAPQKINKFIPWEPTTFIFKGYNPYIGGLKPSFFMVLGSKTTVKLAIFKDI